MANLFPDGWLDEIINGKEIKINKQTFAELLSLIARKLDLMTGVFSYKDDHPEHLKNNAYKFLKKEEIKKITVSNIEKNGQGEGSIILGKTKSLEEYFTKLSLIHLLHAWQQLGQRSSEKGRYILNADRNILQDKKINLTSILDDILISAKAETRLEAYQEVTKILGSDKKYAEALTVTIRSLDNFKNKKINRESGIIKRNENAKKLKKFAQKTAEKLWKDDKDKKIRIGQMCDLVYPLVYEYAVEKDMTEQIPEQVNGLKPWLRKIAPDYAKEGGRPKISKN
ncbi:hypothetical protein KAH27_04305 [bacterium]|nr:hypothetical protein [bacterium]